MGLETGNTIAQLNASWPLGSDPKSEGDDHLRLIKTVVQNDVVPKSTGGTFLGGVTSAPSASDGALSAYGGDYAGVYLGGGDKISRLAMAFEVSTGKTVFNIYDADGGFVAQSLAFDGAGTVQVGTGIEVLNSGAWGQVSVQPGADGQGAQYLLKGHWGVSKASFGIGSDDSVSITAYDDAGTYLGNRLSWVNNSLDTVFGGGISAAGNLSTAGSVVSGYSYLGPLQNSGAQLRNTLGTDAVHFNNWGSASLESIGGPTGVGLVVTDGGNTYYASVYSDAWTPVGQMINRETGMPDYEALAKALEAQAPRYTRRQLEDQIEALEQRLEAAGI